MNKIILILSFGLICLVGMASVSAVDVVDCAVNDSVVCASDVDAYESAGDNASYDNDTGSHGGAIAFDGINLTNSPYIRHDFNEGGAIASDGINLTNSIYINNGNFHIEKNVIGKKMDVRLFGRLDVSNTPAFESIIKDLDNVEELTLDFKYVDYISSSALRVLISMQKVMTQHDGSMKLINVPDDIMDIFDVTGFSDILTIEQ